MTSKRVFPEGFLWGTAGAAHQIEGGNVNSDSWLLEHLPNSSFVEPSGDACDHYHRYPDDIALIAALGFNTYRFSIEWARIEPAEGEFSMASLEHYRRMLVACHEHGLTPIVTYNHFTCPRWFAAKGGWEVSENAALFVRFCERVTAHLGDLINAACTFNEPNLGLMLQKMLRFYPSDEQILQSPERAAAAHAAGSTDFVAFPSTTRHAVARDVYIKAHRMAFDAIKSGRGDFPVGLTLALSDHQAVPGGETYRDQIRAEVDDVFLETARQDDFIGVQTYSRTRYDANGSLPPEEGVERTLMGYEFWPEALEATIRYAAAYTGKPVLVTENGISTEDDTRRVEYIQRALAGVHRCLQDGIEVRGYCYWSIFDNFEWGMGYRPKFGLIAVDRVTQVRTTKPSAAFLGDVSKNNALPD